jgi:putative long chain acyl-CoA synthase
LPLLRNAVEMARFSRLEPGAHTPYSIALRDPIFRLRHYESAQSGIERRPPIILVPPLMLTAEVYDVSREGSAVASLLGEGVDPWVVDFGAPERQKGGLKRTLSDHVVAVSRAVEHVRAATGADVHLSGYSQGGMFCYQTAAYRQSKNLASLITFGSPVNAHREPISWLPEDVAVRVLGGLGELLSRSFSGSAVPAWVSRTGFRLLSPTKEIRSFLEFFTGLQSREASSRREGQRRFLAGEGWVAWPGPALAEFVDQFIQHNRLFSGGFVIDGRPLTLADITCPVLLFVGETDDIARPPTVRAIQEAAPRAQLFEAVLPAGHFGLVVGSKAMQKTWPTTAAWVRWRAGKGSRPNEVRKIGAGTRAATRDSDADGAAVTALKLGLDAIGLVSEWIGDRSDTVRTLVRNVVNLSPRLTRLEYLRRDTRISLALALAEQVAAAPESTFFFYQGRAYSYADTNRRVDAVVRGLLSIGVRQGMRIGVYMKSRPSALAAATAANRLGAVTAFLRPDGDLEREIALAEVELLIADPEHAAQAHAVTGRTVYVLGGGGGVRTLPRGTVDMEAIDPERVVLPEWYEPNPGRSEAVAFILFSGRGAQLRLNRITNRRWALSALGTASAVALTASDTVYCWTPIQHPTGLLVSIGAALVGGARLAVADGFAAATFWDEVRHYGASVVFYTGSMCRELVDASPEPTERVHPVRLFAGSGMPRAVWRRLIERFGPLSVVELYASTEGNAILANLSGAKIGSVGRPLPGSAPVALAAYDMERRNLVQDATGFCRRVGRGQIGVLVARVERDRGALEGHPLLNVFAKGDAWYATSDLFRRDADGDYWLVDHAADLIRGADGTLPSIPIEECIGELDGVSAAAAYGVALPGAPHEIPVVAVVLRHGARLDPRALLDHVERNLEERSRPVIVRVVEHFAMTAGYRVLKQPLRAAGISADDVKHGALWYDTAAHAYKPLTRRVIEQLSTGRNTKAAQRARQRGARTTRPSPRVTRRMDVADPHRATPST